MGFYKDVIYLLIISILVICHPAEAEDIVVVPSSESEIANLPVRVVPAGNPTIKDNHDVAETTTRETPQNDETDTQNIQVVPIINIGPVILEHNVGEHLSQKTVLEDNADDEMGSDLEEPEEEPETEGETGGKASNGEEPVEEREHGRKTHEEHEDDDGAAQAEDVYQGCGSLKECEEEQINGFIETWLTNRGFPGMLFLIGNSVSLLGISGAFITYSSFRQLHSSPRGIAVLNFITALFLAKLAFQMNPYFTFSPRLCSVVALLQHFWCLATFLWMNVVAYDVMMSTFDERSDVTVTDQRAEIKRSKRTVLIYFSFAWGLPLLGVGMFSFLEVYVGDVLYYGNLQQCGVFGSESLLYTLAFPITLISIMNISFIMIAIRRVSFQKILIQQRTLEAPDATTVGEKEPLPDNFLTTCELQVSTSKANNWTGIINSMMMEEDSTQNEPKISEDNIYGEGLNNRQEVMTKGSAEKHPETGDNVAQIDAIMTQLTTDFVARKTRVPMIGPVDDGQEARVVKVNMGTEVSLFGLLKVAMVLSVSWLSGFLAVFTQQYWLWVLFVGMNSLQGILVFTTLVLTAPVIKLYLDKLRFIPMRCRRQSTPDGDASGDLSVVSDGYVLLDEVADVVFIQ